MTEKIPVEELQELINLQFGSQASLARKIGLDDARLSKGIRNQSPKFMAKLKKIGLKLETLEGSGAKGSNKDLRDKLKGLQERIIVLESMLKDKDNVIEHQSNLLERYSALLGKPTGKK